MLISKINKLFIGLVLFLAFIGCRRNAELPYQVSQQLITDTAMVVSAHPLASDIGLHILKKGGSAVDAMVATQFALAVVYPRAGNIGGGGFMVTRSAKGELSALDFREMAPGLAHRDMYLDSLGNVIENLSTIGHLAAGVPGSVAGLFEAHKKFGTLPWEDLLEPSIEIAFKGFPIMDTEAERLNRFKEDFEKVNTHQPVFVRNRPWKQGSLLVQKELGKALQRISKNGKDGFYSGETAKLIVEEMKRGGGLISLDDLKNYVPKWRDPLTGYYKDYKIISMPPSSSGGVALLQMLEMSETLPLQNYGQFSVEAVHGLSETMRRAYADRAEHLGDMDHYDVPLERLLDSAYLVNRMSDFNADSSSISTSIDGGAFKLQMESFETTHTSVIDKDGNAASLTTTINSNYGSKVVVKGAGFFLNNEMDDFSAKTGVPNQFGLVGNEANAIAPGKRMLSSMTPTIIEKDEKLFMVIGTPGGSTIMTSVFLVFLNVTEFGMDLGEAIRAPRFHHQWLPDEIMMEKDEFSNELKNQLIEKGHSIREVDRIAKMKAIMVLPNGKLMGVGDSRLNEDDASGY